MNFFYNLIMASIPSLFSPVVKFIKLELLGLYIRAVDRARGFFTLWVLTLFSVMFVMSGFVMIHGALFLLMPWSTQTNALIILGVGCFYFIVPSVVVVKLCSRRAWLNVSGANDMHRSISGED